MVCATAVRCAPSLRCIRSGTSRSYDALARWPWRGGEVTRCANRSRRGWGRQSVLEVVVAATPEAIRNAQGRDETQAEEHLRAAIKGNSLAELRAYLDSRRDVNMLLPSGESALHLAVAFDRPRMVEMLIASGANPELRNRREQTPVHMARGNTLDVLLRFGVDTGVHDGLGATPLHHARRETALMLIDQGVDIEARDRAGGTPLLRAVERGDHELVQLLVDYGADVNASDVRRGATAVHRAVARRDLDLIRYLLSHGAYINARDRYGSTPLDWTDSPLTGGGRPDTLSVVHLLIENGAH